MGYPNQRAVNKGTERTAVGVVGYGQAGGERGQVSRSEGENRRCRSRSGSCSCR